MNKKKLIGIIVIAVVIVAIAVVATLCATGVLSGSVQIGTLKK